MTERNSTPRSITVSPIFTCSIFATVLLLTIFSALLKAENEVPNEVDWVTSPKVLSEIERLEGIYPERSAKIRWERTGHQYTTYIVAMEAGLRRPRSHELAFYSQYPDDEKQFSATLAFFNIFDLEHRKQIMSSLHSLHGGEHADVLRRRQDILYLIKDGIRNGNLDDRQLGLMIHALGDSYAHTTGDLDDGDLQAFGYAFGHLFHGTKPDVIVYNPKKYRRYACALYDALGGEGDCFQRLVKLFGLIEELKVSRNTALPEFESLATSQYGFNQVKYESFWRRGDPPLNKAEVTATTNAMEAKFAMQSGDKL